MTGPDLRSVGFSRLQVKDRIVSHPGVMVGR